MADPRGSFSGFRVLVIIFLLGGCAHYQKNEAAPRFDSQAGYRFDLLEPGAANSDSLFVCLMFSGGGTRAAALSYGVMEALRGTVVRVNGQTKSLLDEVDCISSVSGGSFTAAYYGLFRDRLFADFRSRFLERDIQGALAAGLFNPVNWIRLLSPDYSRIDMAANIYDQEVFDGATIGRLAENGRPFVILNATNLGSGRRFDFTQEHFDAIGSRLEEYPVARAVAASSAFPYLLSPISLVNYPTAEGYQPPWWYPGALNPEDWAGERYAAAENLDVYLDKHNRYIHLMDGGLADNIGARAILDAFKRGFILSRMNAGVIRQLVLIVVNARTESQDRLSRKESPPGLFTVAEKTATVAMDNYSFASVTTLREDLYTWVQAQKDTEACGRLLAERCPKAPGLFASEANIDPYVVEINFNAVAQIPGEDPQYYLDLPTSFKLSAEQVEKLVTIGPKLLRAAPQFDCLLQVLAAEEAGLPRPAECPLGAGIKGKGAHHE
jgi:NTE family protein